jgi:hypothetical protein
MKNDLFDLSGLTPNQRAWRVVVIAAIVAVLLLDVFVWRI